MAKKPKLSKDAFDWIKPAATVADVTKADKHITSSISHQPAASQMITSEDRSIYFIFWNPVNRNDPEWGFLVSIEEQKIGVKMTTSPYSAYPEGTGGSISFPLTGEELKGKSLLELHTLYKLNQTGTDLILKNPQPHP